MVRGPTGVTGTEVCGAATTGAVGARGARFASGFGTLNFMASVSGTALTGTAAVGTAADGAETCGTDGSQSAEGRWRFSQVPLGEEGDTQGAAGVGSAVTEVDETMGEVVADITGDGSWV